MAGVKRPRRESCPRSRDDYTIGWISALPVEDAAAGEMLDEEHDEIPVAEGDDNAYTLGKIGQHDVVMTLINEAGGLPAHVVATNMMKSFRNIRYVLMVGIGGGIPSAEYRIRLGDVVVSKAKDRSSGVVQSDFGKWEEDGFKVKGALNLPAAGLMKVVGKVASQSLRGKYRKGDIHTFVKHLKPDAFADMEDWKYQGRDHDPLYKEDTNLRKDGVCEKCKEQPDSHCPDPRIHYGIIASGNSVIKSRKQRDKLQEDLGACCVEMEAFGLMNHFPCLVIRGISDYADGEKNDKWQPYSALTAAAYAKQLLLHLSVEDVGKTPHLSEQVVQQLKRIEDGVNAGRRHDEEQTREKIFEWLSCLTPWKEHHSTLKHCVEGTGKVLWERFTEWDRHEPEKQMLVALGNPGAGKTVAMSVLIDHIDQLTEGSANISTLGLAYVYLDYKNGGQQTEESVIGTVIRQLLNTPSRIPDLVQEMWEGCKTREAKIDDYIKMLSSACSTFTRAYICIDALDEYKKLPELLKILGEVIESVPSIRLICTGRPTITVSIEEMNVLTTWINIEAREDDVRALIKQRIKESRHNIGDDEQKEITEKLLKKYDNIFLLPVLHISLVLEEPTRTMRKQTLDSLEESLAETFGQSLKRIEESGRRKSETAKRVLMWVHLAARPLTFEQLSHALATKDNGGFDPDNVVSRDYLVRSCLGLVIIETGNSPVRLCHLGLHEYFRNMGEVCGESISVGHKELACTCFRSMLYEHRRRNSKRAAESSDPFLDYSSCFWDHHTQESGQHDERVKLAAEYLSLDFSCQFPVQPKHYRKTFLESGFATSMPVFTSGLHLAALHGLEEVVDLLLKSASMQKIPTAINCKDENGFAPLHWVARSGQTMMVEKLLKGGACCKSRDLDGRTALHYAVLSHSTSMIELLAPHENGQLLNIQDDFGLTALHLAVLMGNIESQNACQKVSLLRAKGARVDVCNLLQRSPLDEARKFKLDRIVQLLQDDNIDSRAQADSSHENHTSRFKERPRLELGLRQVYMTSDIYLMESMKAYMEIYTEIHSLHTDYLKLPFHVSNGEKVGADGYNALKDCIDEHVKEIANAAAGKTDNDLLSFYIRRWNHYVKAATFMNHLWRYFNRHWIKERRDKGDSTILDVFELHLACWKDGFFTPAYERILGVLKDRQQRGKPLLPLHVEEIVESDWLGRKYAMCHFAQPELAQVLGDVMAIDG